MWLLEPVAKMAPNKDTHSNDIFKTGAAQLRPSDKVRRKITSEAAISTMKINRADTNKRSLSLIASRIQLIIIFVYNYAALTSVFDKLFGDTDCHF